MSAINPATDELLKEIEFDHISAIEIKFQKAKTAQHQWASTPLKIRIECIRDFAQLLLENKEELAKDLTLEVGKPIRESLAEIAQAAKKCEFFIEKSETLLAQERVNTDGMVDEVIAYDPLGVIANISAWNYPYLVGINIFVPALICGNAVLYKPSERALISGHNIARLLWQAGVPKDVFNLVFGDKDSGKFLAKLPLDGYFLTGSQGAGMELAKALAGRLVPIGLELGGKDPLYVTEDVESVEEAAISASEGAFYNNGQSCCSVERIYVHKKIYDEFLFHFVKRAKSLKVGDPLDPATEMGALTIKEWIPYLEKQLDDALAKGAKLECGGERVGSIGNFFAPTVLSNVNHSMLVMREETFGPIVGIQKVSGDEEAIELMNDTEYGLTSAVFTQNTDRGLSILSQINSGSGYLNCCDRVSSHLPWSGRKASGLGSTLSKHGLYAFCRPKGLHLKVRDGA